jgi:HAD superfamily hydrolase (TIGR01549 family)
VEAKVGKAPDLDEVTKRFQEVYMRVRDNERLVPSAKFLSTCASQVPMGIITGRPRDEADFVLKRFKIEGSFGPMRCMEDGPAKPAPDLLLAVLGEMPALPENGYALFFGDTVDDIRAALACKPKCVIPVGVVPPGKTEAAVEAHEQHLYEAGAWRVVRNPQEMLELLQGVGLARLSI